MFNERFSPTHGQVRLQASLEGSPGWWHIHLGRMNLRFSFRASGWSRKSSKERSFLAWCEHFCFDALKLEDSMEAWEEQNVEWSPKCHVNAQDAFCFCLKAGWTCSILRVLSCRPIFYGIMSMYLYICITSFTYDALKLYFFLIISWITEMDNCSNKNRCLISDLWSSNVFCMIANDIWYTASVVSLSLIFELLSWIWRADAWIIYLCWSLSKKRLDL